MFFEPQTLAHGCSDDAQPSRPMSTENLSVPAKKASQRNLSRRSRACDLESGWYQRSIERRG